MNSFFPKKKPSVNSYAMALVCNGCFLILAATSALAGAFLLGVNLRTTVNRYAMALVCNGCVLILGTTSAMPGAFLLDTSAAGVFLSL